MQSIIALIKSLFQRIIALFRRRDTDDPGTDIPGIFEPVVPYYGCPNSKKAEKLQLSKKIYR